MIRTFKGVIRFFIILLPLSISTQIASQEKNTSADNNWKTENNQNLNTTKDFSGVELIHAEEGKYLGAQKSKEGIIIFHGGIKLRINNDFLTADTVKINQETGEILGEGAVTLTDGVQVIKGSKFFYDNSIHAGVLYSLHGHLNQPDSNKVVIENSQTDDPFKPIYIMGDYAKISSMDNFVVSAAYLTSCEAENPHYYFKAQKIWIQPNNRFVALGVIYFAGDIPIFYFPFFFETDIGTGIKVLFGYNPDKGIFIQNTFPFGFPGTSFLPENSALMLDFYEFDGFYLGTHLAKKSPNLDYDITLGIASFLGKNITQTSSGMIVTNNVLNADGTINKIPFQYEINAVINAKWNLSFDQDSKSKVDLRFEQYNSNIFESTFKQRIIPSTLSESMVINRALSTLTIPFRNNLVWEAVYSENWQDNQFVVKMAKYSTWNIIPQLKNSYDYYPQSDIFPNILFTKNWYLIKPTGARFQGLMNQISLSTGISRDYLNNEIFHTINQWDLKDGFKAFFPLLNVLNFQPSVGYGVKGQSYNSETPAQTIENGIKSFEYIYSINDLFLGPNFMRAKISYSYQYATVQKKPDPYFDRVRDNKLLFNLFSDFAPYGMVSIGTARDMRKFPGSNNEMDHWDPLFASASFDYDFVNKDNIFLPGVYTPNKYFMGMGMNETFYYNIRYNTAGQNTLDMYFQAGGYRFLIFDRMQKIRAGVLWTNNFLNYNQNNIKLYLETKINFLKYWLLEFNITGSAYGLGTQSQPYANLNNILNSTKTPFYLDGVTIMLEHDLHDWTIQLSYSLKQSWIPFYIVSPSLKNYAGFYESQIFLNFNYKGIKGSGLQNQISDTNTPRQNPAKFGLN